MISIFLFITFICYAAYGYPPDPTPTTLTYTNAIHVDGSYDDLTILNYTLQRVANYGANTIVLELVSDEKCKIYYL
jgi:hypothetical protein